MKGRKTLPLIAGAIALMLAFGFLWRQGVTYHTRSWHRATQLAMGDRLSWWDRIYGALISKQQPQYWWDQAKRTNATRLFWGVADAIDRIGWPAQYQDNAGALNVEPCRLTAATVNQRLVGNDTWMAC